MEMNQIRYFLAASRSLNFTRAARDCNVSQPALTKAIRKLEEELGAPLFFREGRNVMLSAFGQSMIPHLEQIIRGAEATRIMARNFRLLNRAPLRLGVMSTVGHVRLARFLASFEKCHTGVELSVHETAVDDLIRQLTDGETDLAVVTLQPGITEDFRALPLYRERYVVILPPDHKLQEQEVIRLSDLSGEPYVDRLACEMRETVLAVCEDQGIELYARFRSEREDWIQAMVLAGIGFAFMPEFSVSLPGLLQRPLTQPAVSREVALLTAPGRPHTPAISAFLTAARGYAWPG